MTRNSFNTNHADDQPLVDFLRQHRPEPPAPLPDLEIRLMAAIAAEPQHAPARTWYPSPRQWLVLVPTMAAGFLSIWVGARSPMTSAIAQQESSQELAEFFATSWNGSLSQGASYTWLTADATATTDEALETPMDEPQNAPTGTPEADPTPDQSSSQRSTAIAG